MEKENLSWKRSSVFIDVLGTYSKPVLLHAFEFLTHVAVWLSQNNPQNLHLQTLPAPGEMEEADL